MRVLLTALLATTLAVAAAAQPAKSMANWDNLSRLVPGSEIRITLTAGKTLRGFVQHVTPESLAINATTSQETVSRQDIRRVALKTGFRISERQYSRRSARWLAPSSGWRCPLVAGATFTVPRKAGRN